MSQAALTQQNSYFRICVDEVKHGGIVGTVYSQRLLKPVAFSGLAILFLDLERLMEAQNFPQAYQRIRTFSPAVPLELVAGMLPDGSMSQAEVDSFSGAVSTFRLHVVSRQSSTWQGTLDWLDGSEPQPFVSDLELLALLDVRLVGITRRENPFSTHP